jgi:type IV secretory pathway TrbD component
VTPEPEGFSVPLHQSLTNRILMAGVPRQVAIVNATLGAALSIGLHVWWLGIPLAVALHAIAYRLCRGDPYFFEVLVHHVRHKQHLDT